MAVWEIIILMAAATVCVSFGIGFVYSSIVNTVERYQVHKTERELRMYAKVFEELPKFVTALVERMKEIEKI